MLALKLDNTGQVKPNVRSREGKQRIKLKNNFPFYARNILKIRTKSGKIEPLIFNTAQIYLNSRLEEQKKKTGKVRAIVLKGRQQGCSTYIGARFYHRSTHKRGIKTFILTHESDATTNLFGMVQRYYDHTPGKLRPHVSSLSQKTIKFDLLDSGYQVGTAGTKGVGRSNTIQLFHGSEVAFWPHADEHIAGILQAVPDEKGTEVILESTANGQGNIFHEKWTQAVAGLSEYIAIFIPWFWQAEYETEPPQGFTLNEEEQEYQGLYNLSLKKMAWRRNKIIEFNGDIALFKQEYPATAEEAFQFSKTDSLIKSEPVVKARKTPQFRSFGAVIAGFDPSRDGDDKDAFIYRQTRNAFGLEYKEFYKDKRGFGQRIAYLKQKLDSKSPYIDILFIDYGGSGWELAARLEEDGYGDRIRVVNFGSNARNQGAYKNRRSEMWGEMKKWLTDEEIPVSIPDNEQLHAEMVAPGYWHNSNQQLILEPKENVKDRLKSSTDGADALALTFAEKVVRQHVQKSNVPQKAVTDFDIYGG